MTLENKECANYKYIGKNIPRQDGPDKVTGEYRYLADEIPSDALVGVLLLSPHANA